ncbi:MAG: hypothetical protein OHK0015_55340 [Chloroflexi bacterium OHK40]
MDRTPQGRELSTTLEAKLTPFVEQLVASFGLAGAAVGVVLAGELVYARGFGTRNLDTGEPVTPRTLFHLASVSKSFVATAVVQLAEQGKLALGAPVVNYLPYFRLKDPRYRAITIQQMLSHTSGMPDAVDYAWHASEDDDGALERYVRSLADQELIADPGEKFGYSNIAFEVLGALIARVSGQPFEAYVASHILTPLEMHTSTFMRREVPPDLAATPHLGAPLRVLGNAYPYHRAHAPSSSLHSSIVELSHWASANFNRGHYHGRQILRPESYELIWRQHVRTGNEGWDEATGLGWFFGTYRGQQMIYHNGSDPGFSSELVLLPEHDAAVIVLVNANTAATGHITDGTLSLLLGLEPQLPTPPITLPVGAALAAEGPDRASALYHELLRSQPDAYDARPSHFLDAVWGAIELGRADAVLPLVRLWVTLQPDASPAYEALGWAQLVQGELDEAASNLRQALSLDPDNWHARRLLAQAGLESV